MHLVLHCYHRPYILPSLALDINKIVSCQLKSMRNATGKHFPLSGVRHSIDFRFAVGHDNRHPWWACKFKDTVVSTWGRISYRFQHFGYPCIYAVVTHSTVPNFFRNFYIQVIWYFVFLFPWQFLVKGKREARANQASPLSSPQEARCYVHTIITYC